MMDRLRYGWTIRRFFYLIAGGGLMVISVIDHQWPGLLMGGYFAAMGLFSFGCAAGQCTGGSCEPDDVTSSERS